ncbi:OmcA/MtrC family decaheme c-type cytochrome [Shewanella fidelis]|uniref:OmcA/MtrC family decaheme c-type cytochrome n=1 Tax=Shewanella fidelis TaxID=173509 RepID=UPI0004B6E21F|nr:OmcA/MtrC family decaheme c-type cytochrome [Shewanella fidelis]
MANKTYAGNNMMMNQYKFTNAVKAAIGISALSLALVGCGSDGKDGEDGDNGNIGVDIQQATSLKANILHATITEGVVAVDFELLTANGVAVSGLESFKDINALGFGVAKLDALQKRSRPLPGFDSPAPEAEQYKGVKATQWTSYINTLKEPGSIADGQDLPEGWDKHQGPQLQANIETSCKTDCIEVLGHGEYRYTFSKALSDYEQIEGLDTTFNAELTHRITLELKPTNVVSNATLINTHYDFIPALDRAAEADETRNLVDLQESCIRCHNDDYEHAWAPKLSLHGGKRIEIENCVVCHTSYSGDPETGATIDFGSMLHQIHKGDYFMIGYGGKAHDYSNATFPADSKSCQSCHIEGETAPAQADNFHFHRQEACLSCHEKFAAPEWDGTARGLFHSEQFPQYIEGDCAACHADASNPMGAAKFHLNKELTLTSAKEAYKFSVANGVYDADLQTLTFNVSFSGQGGLAPHEDEAINALNVQIVENQHNDFADVWKMSRGDLTATHKMINLADQAAIEAGEISVEASADGYQYTVQLTGIEFETGALMSHLNICASRDTQATVACSEEHILATVTTNPAAFATIGEVASLRFNSASESACQACHDDAIDLSFHQRTSCGSCHMPDSKEQPLSLTDGSCVSCHKGQALHAVADGAFKGSRVGLENSLDYKVMIHTLHANKRTKVNSNRNETITFTKHYGDCASCHEKSQLALENTANLPAVLNQGENGSDDIREYSPIAAACGSCHTKASYPAHVESNGGVFGAPLGSYSGSESCATCHAEGKSFGVDKVHPVNYK